VGGLMGATKPIESKVVLTYAIITWDSLKFNVLYSKFDKFNFGTFWFLTRNLIALEWLYYYEKKVLV